MKCPVCEREFCGSGWLIHHLEVEHKVFLSCTFSRGCGGYAQWLWRCGCGLELSITDIIEHLQQPTAKGCVTLLALMEAPSAI